MKAITEEGLRGEFRNGNFKSYRDICAPKGPDGK